MMKNCVIKVQVIFDNQSNWGYLSPLLVIWKNLLVKQSFYTTQEKKDENGFFFPLLFKSRNKAEKRNEL